MGKLTTEMEEKIQEEFAKDPSFTRVAKMLDLDARTIAKVVRTEGGMKGTPKVAESQEALAGTQKSVKHPPLSDGEEAARAFELYAAGKSPVQVACIMKITAEKALMYYADFMKLQSAPEVAKIFVEDPDRLRSIVSIEHQLGPQASAERVAKWIEKVQTIERLESVTADRLEKCDELQNKVEDLQELQQQKQENCEFLDREIEAKKQFLQKCDKDNAEKERQAKAKLSGIDESIKKRNNDLQALPALYPKITEFVEESVQVSINNQRDWLIAYIYAMNEIIQTKANRFLYIFQNLFSCADQRARAKYWAEFFDESSPVIEQLQSKWMKEFIINRVLRRTVQLDYSLQWR